MEDAIQLVFTIAVPVGLLLLGLIVGGQRERHHFAQLDRRERGMQDILVTQVKTFPHHQAGERPPMMVIGEAVIATDYLKSFLASLRNFFGGEVRSYQTLMSRARREALLRAMAEARRAGFNALCNVRYQTADVGGSNAGRKVAMAAIIAVATAYHAEPPS